MDQSKHEAGTFENVTLFFQSEFGFGIKRLECRSVTVEIKKYAQYERAIHVTFVPKGARKARIIIQDYKPNLVIAKGWNLPEPKNYTDESVTTDAKTGVSVRVSQGRFSSFSEGWSEVLEECLRGATVLRDYRGHNALSRY